MCGAAADARLRAATNTLCVLRRSQGACLAILRASETRLMQSRRAPSATCPSLSAPGTLQRAANARVEQQSSVQAALSLHFSASSAALKQALEWCLQHEHK